MALQRTAYNRLQDWRSSTSHKPLMLRGARQVGKTTLVREFGATFDQYIELNLDREEDRAVFQRGDLGTVLNAVQVLKRIELLPGRTLLFIDEIQAEPKAIHLLRYFYEERPDLHVIAAGSLLEFAMKEVTSMPVGRITFQYLHPLNFQEYLMAVGNAPALKALMSVPLPDGAHGPLRNMFHEYAIIGGMPEVVDHFVKKRSLLPLRKIFTDLWHTYQEDVEKYARNSTEQNVLMHVLATAHTELDRIKLEGFGNGNYRAREVGEALRSLGKAGVIRTMYASTSLQPPIAPDLRKRPRLQFLDTGLLIHALDEQGPMIGIQDLADVRRGRIVEHLVVQEIISTNDDGDRPPCFWVREESTGNAEVDILARAGALVIPVEVKSGAHGRLRSLHQFMDRAPHPYAVRMYNGDLKVERHTTPAGTPYILLNLPYYLGTRLGAYLDWLMNEHQI